MRLESCLLLARIQIYKKSVGLASNIEGYTAVLGEILHLMSLLLYDMRVITSLASREKPNSKKRPRMP